MAEIRKSVTGVRQEDFSEEVWHGIASAYFRSAYQLPDSEKISPDRWYYRSAIQILNGGGEYRFGSLISIHSKLEVCQYNRGKLHFGFHANADPYELAWAASEGITPETIQGDFQTRITAFLGGIGLAQEISDCYDIRQA